MAYFTEANSRIAGEIVDRYPRSRSAMIPLLHLAQEQEGWISRTAMVEIAALTATTPAEVFGTASFYEMFKFAPVGRYVVNICTNISCQLLGGEELLEHIEGSLGIKAGGTTEDGMFTVEEAECVAACTEAPCFTVYYRYFHRADAEMLESVIDDLRNGRNPMNWGNQGDSGQLPEHGILARVRQHIPEERRAGVEPPHEVESAPAWLRAVSVPPGDSDG